MSDDKKYDVFLSYNSLDHLHVERIANALKERGCSSFIDRWYLAPGQDWVVALERALQASRSVAVFLGDREMGRWQQRERAWALDQLAGRDDFPVIPVLLPGSEPPLGFMKQLMWIDLRTDPTDSTQLDKLVAAIRREEFDQDGKPEPRAALCPYRGLFAFREEDAEFFFGRQKYTDDLFELVQKKTIVAVAGASGSGKSSVVRAGLVPRLRRRDAGGVWDIVTMFPHENPFHSLSDVLLPLVEPELAGVDLIKKRKSLAEDLECSNVPLWDLVVEALRQQRGTDRLLLVVDQWEELYTNCKSETQRSRFIQELMDATSRNSSPLSVVFTIRWDFYDEILKHRLLVDRLQQSRLDLGPMNRAELRSVIEEPGRKVGLSFQDGLVERILGDAGEEPGKLPLLEFVLEELWKYRTGDGQLTHAAYDKLGRLTGAIATRAEAVFGKLTAEEQSAAELLFRRLVKAGAKSEEDTRRRADLQGLDATMQRVACKLADERLLVTTRADGVGETASLATEATQPANETVEVAHEELLRSWDRLKKWVDADRKFLQWRSRLIPLLAEFERDPKSALLKGLALRESSKYVPARVAELEPYERQFVESSQKAGRRRKVFAAVMTAVLIIGGLFVAQKVHESTRQRQAHEYVESLLNPAAGSVEPYLRLLEPFRDLAEQELRREFRDENREPIQHVHAAYGLIQFFVDTQEAMDFLLDSVSWLPKYEWTNLRNALNTVHESGLFKDKLESELERRFDRVTSESDRNRFALVQLDLGIENPASSLCRVKADPTSRSLLICGFKDFPANLSKTSEILKSTHDSEWRSALCSAIGTLGKEAAKSTHLALINVFVKAPDGGTHSAADWALRQQGLTEEELLDLANEPDALSEELRGEREWYVNHVNMTMLKVPERVFAMGSVNDNENPSKDDKPEEYKSFWMSDREINVRQFFLVRQQPIPQHYSTNGNLPMTEVSWFDAVEFCNLLSKQSKLKEAYSLKGINRNDQGFITIVDDVTETGGDGYRLPTEREWEYSCRAMSLTDFNCGNDFNLLSEFAVIGESTPKSCGSKVPNAWGLFDMHGNVYEWCWNNEGEFRVIRGGSFDFFRPRWLWSTVRNATLKPDSRLNDVGFRVCRTHIRT